MMNERLKLLEKKLKDERSKKVIFVAHCILNENTRYLGGAFRKGCIDEIVDEIQRQGIGIVQMKCPEQKATGYACGAPLIPLLININEFPPDSHFLKKVRIVCIIELVWAPVTDCIPSLS